MPDDTHDEAVLGLAEHWKDADYPAPTDVTVSLARALLRCAQRPSIAATKDEVPAGYVEECERVIQHLSSLLHDIRYDRKDWKQRLDYFSNHGVDSTAPSHVAAPIGPRPMQGEPLTPEEEGTMQKCRSHVVEALNGVLTEQAIFYRHHIAELSKQPSAIEPSSLGILLRKCRAYVDGYEPDDLPNEQDTALAIQNRAILLHDIDAMLVNVDGSAEKPK
jgi:hypothetical protein